MTDTAPAPPPDVSRLLDPKAMDRPAPVGQRLRIRLAIALPIVLVLVIVLGTGVLLERRQTLLHGIDERLGLLASGRVALIDERLDRLVELPSYVIDSDAFRLFATEVDLVSADDPLAVQLHAMTPYMIEALSELVRQRGLVAAYLIARDGESVLASGSAPELSPAERQPAERVFADATPYFSPVHRRADALALDLFLPVRAVQAPTPDMPADTVAVFMMTVPVAEMLAAFVRLPDLAEPGERVVLVQQAAGGASAVATGQAARFRPVDGSAVPPVGELARGPSPLDGQPVFARALPIERLAWQIVQEVDEAIAIRPLLRARLVVFLIAGLFVVAVATIGIALLSGQANAFNRQLAEQYHRLARRIDAHRRLLDSINSTIREMIGLKRPDGTYAYVNAAFVQVVDRPEDQIIGQTDEGVFGHGQAEWLEQADRQALETGTAIRAEQRLYVDGNLHYLEISKVPLIGEDGQPDGIVSVARDVTELVEERRRREAALHHTVDALIKTIEFSDPYLSGHARLVGRIAELMARGIGLGATDSQTLEIAANVAQIGKLFVPRDIVSKPGRLSADEQAEMERHIEYARAVLAEIDFDLPVEPTIAAMYERLDGSGYPLHLHGEEIPLLSRILGLADVFCARIRPRSYRSGVSPEEARQLLRAHSAHKFGNELLDVLDRVLATTEGEKLMALARTEI